MNALRGTSIVVSGKPLKPGSREYEKLLKTLVQMTGEEELLPTQRNPSDGDRAGRRSKRR